MHNSAYRHVLILADIEGSSGCGCYRASSFMTKPWAQACRAMSRDVDALVKGLFEAGVDRVTVKDFHRTAFNLLPELIDERARIVCGYRQGPVPGLGNPADADALMMIGMHAAAGTHGFLAHTLTSRLAALEVDGRPLAEVELFAASVAPYGIPPLFFSGCPVACTQARERIPGIHTFVIDKSVPPKTLDAGRWRKNLVRAAVASLTRTSPAPYCPNGPFHAKINIRDGMAAAMKMADRWRFKRCGDRIFIEAPDMQTLYRNLIGLCYLTPLVEKTLPLSLATFNLIGRLGRLWVRRQLARSARD